MSANFDQLTESELRELLRVQIALSNERRAERARVRELEREAKKELIKLRREKALTQK